MRVAICTSEETGEEGFEKHKSNYRAYLYSA